MKVKCYQCGTEIEKEDKEYKRQMKKTNGEARFFCNLSCTASYRNLHMSNERYERNKNHMISMQPLATARAARTNYKGRFTYYIRKAQSRKHDTDLDNEFLETLWEEQKGKCAISGIDILIHNNVSTTSEKPMLTASLDRIDSKKGYMRGNVQFVATPLNYAKHTYGDNEFRQFLMEVAKSMMV